MEYQFIKNHLSEFTVKKMCHVLKISESGYQHWKKRKPSLKAMRKKHLKQKGVFTNSTFARTQKRITQHTHAFALTRHNRTSAQTQTFSPTQDMFRF